MIREADPMAGQPRRARFAKVFKTKPYNPSKPKTAIISPPELGFNFKTKITFSKLKVWPESME